MLMTRQDSFDTTRPTKDSIWRWCSNLQMVPPPPFFFPRFPFDSFLILPFPGTIYTYVWRNFNVLPVAYRAYPRGKPPTLLHLTRLDPLPFPSARATPGHPSRIFIPRICINLISHLPLVRTSNFLSLSLFFLWSLVGWLKKKKKEEEEEERKKRET